MVKDGQEFLIGVPQKLKTCLEIECGACKTVHNKGVLSEESENGGLVGIEVFYFNFRLSPSNVHYHTIKVCDCCFEALDMFSLSKFEDTSRYVANIVNDEFPKFAKELTELVDRHPEVMRYIESYIVERHTSQIYGL